MHVGAPAMMLAHTLLPLAQQREIDAEAAIRVFCARDRLEQQIHRSAALHGRQLRGDVRKATGLRRNLVSRDQALQSMQDRGNALDGICRWIYADHSVPTSVEQTFECRKQYAACVIRRMVRLRANRQHSRLAERVSAASYIANLGRRENKIFVAHDLRYGGGHLGHESRLQRLEVISGDEIAQNVLAKRANCHAADWHKSGLVEAVINKPGDFVLEQGLRKNLGKLRVGKRILRCHSLLLRSRRDSGKLIPRLYLVGFGKQLPKISKARHNFSGQVTRNRRVRLVILVTRGRIDCALLALFSGFPPGCLVSPLFLLALPSWLLPSCLFPVPCPLYPMPMRVFHCDVHAIDLPAGHQFPAGKYKLIRERLMCDGFTLQLASLAPVELVKLVHSESYVNDFLSGSLSPAAVRRIGFPWSEGLVRRTRTSVGGTLAAVEDAFERGWGANLAGGTHHAFADGGAGYCVFNDLAIAIQWLRRDGRIRRAAVIDLDVHQGDGT